MNQEFTITVFTENHVGMLGRLSLIFSRRGMNIERLTVNDSSIDGIKKITIVLNAINKQVIKIVKQIEKQVDVLKAFYHGYDEILHHTINSKQEKFLSVN